jgi:hypothetical protein
MGGALSQRRCAVCKVNSFSAFCACEFLLMRGIFYGGSVSPSGSPSAGFFPNRNPLPVIFPSVSIRGQQ